jgi:hypothetical protein
LLKTLEEPPPDVIFIFATTEVHKVLPTILSRCQRFDLRRIPTQLIARHLAFIAEQENVRLSHAAAEAIAVAADGGLRDAESMLDQLVAFCGQDVGEKEVLEVFGLTSERVVIDIFRAVIGRNPAEALTLIDRQAEAGKDFARLLADLLVFARSLLVFKVDPAALRDDLARFLDGKPVSVRVPTIVERVAARGRRRKRELLALLVMAVAGLAAVVVLAAVPPRLSAQAPPAKGGSGVLLQIHPHVGDTLHLRLEQQTELSGTRRGRAKTGGGGGSAGGAGGAGGTGGSVGSDTDRTKSTRTTMLISSPSRSTHSANFVAARTVFPP